MVLHLLKALGASAIAALVLTVAYNYLYMTPLAARLRAKSRSTIENDQSQLGWLLNHEAGRLLVRAALESRPEDTDQAGSAFYRELGNAWNDKYPDSMVALHGYSGLADPFHPVMLSPGGSIAERDQPAHSLTTRSRGRHQTDVSVAHQQQSAPGRTDYQLELDAMPLLSP